MRNVVSIEKQEDSMYNSMVQQNMDGQNSCPEFHG